MRQAYIDEQNRLQAEYQALLNQQAQQAEEEARLAPLVEAVQRENEADWNNMDFGDWAKRVGAGAVPIAGAVGGSALGGALGTLVAPGIGTVIGAGLGGALSGGLGSLASTGLNSEIAKSDAYEYQKALNALKLARGEGITQTPEQASDIARQNTGITENPTNTWTNVGFDTLGGLIGGGGLANVAGKALVGKAGAGIGGKILGAVGSRPVDYLVNATQGYVSPTLQENPLFEGDYGTEKAPGTDSAIGVVTGLGLSGLGHALPSIAKGSSDFVQALTGQRLKNVDPNQVRLSQQAQAEAEVPDEVVQEATQKPASMLQGLFDKINLGKPKNDYIGAYDVQKSNVVPEKNVMPESVTLDDLFEKNKQNPESLTPEEANIIQTIINAPAQYRTGIKKTSADIAKTEAKPIAKSKPKKKGK